MSQITVSHLTFAYDGACDNVFEDISFVLDTDWRLGFTGRNGRGKTTFLKLLDGTLDSRGAVRAGVPVLYFPFPVEYPEDDTQAVLERLLPDCPAWRILRELNLLGVEQDVLYRPFYTMSNGEQTKILLASLFLHDGAFLLIDEPTNHLDAGGRRLLGEYLAQKRGYILVSHDRDLLDRCADHMLVLNRRDITVMQGNFTVWEENKRVQDDRERAENERLEKDIARLGEAARRTERWSGRAEQEKHARNSGLRPDRGFLGHKAAKLMQRSKSIQRRREEAVEEKKQLLQNLERQEALAVTPLPCRAGARLAEFRDVAVCYDGRTVCREITFEVLAGERIALQGANGCGKSSLLKLLLGEEIPHSGTVETMSGLVVSYVSQNTDHLRGSLTEFARTQGLDGSRFRTILRKLDVPREQFEKDLADYSSGQKKKVLLAASLCTQAHLYVWDEPLNFIDVISRMQVEDLLLACRPTLLFVEHDARFCDEIATRRIRIRRE